MLSKEEAVSFITESLKISSPLEKVAEDSYQFLEELLLAFATKNPFQNISTVSIPPHLRHRPTLDEIKTDILSGKGGKCYFLNVFMKFLLESLGYNVYLIGSNVQLSNSNNHVVMIVNNLKSPGDKYVADVGIGYPCFTPIPLDFEEETPVYSQSFLQFKYVRKGSKIARYHKKNRFLMDTPPSTEEKWWEFCVMDLTRRDLSYFDGIMDEIYGNPDSLITPFHNTFRIVGYNGSNSRFVALKDLSLLLENESHVLEEVKLGSVEELLEKVKLYYPLLHGDAEKAVKYLNLLG